jgi:hypothetical protein
MWNEGPWPSTRSRWSIKTPSVTAIGSRTHFETRSPRFALLATEMGVGRPFPLHPDLPEGDPVDRGKRGSAPGCSTSSCCRTWPKRRAPSSEEALRLSAWPCALPERSVPRAARRHRENGTGDECELPRPPLDVLHKSSSRRPQGRMLRPTRSPVKARSPPSSLSGIPTSSCRPTSSAATGSASSGATRRAAPSASC